MDAVAFSSQTESNMIMPENNNSPMPTSEASSDDGVRTEAADPTTSSIPPVNNLQSEVAAALGGANAEPTNVGPDGPVDVAGVLDELQESHSETLDWRGSLSDLLTLLNLDTGIAGRERLAVKLGYAGNTNDKATMDEWLHSALLKAIAENAGKVPSNLLE